MHTVAAQLCSWTRTSRVDGAAAPLCQQSQIPIHVNSNIRPVCARSLNAQVDALIRQSIRISIVLAINMLDLHAFDPTAQLDLTNCSQPSLVQWLQLARHASPNTCQMIYNQEAVQS